MAGRPHGTRLLTAQGGSASQEAGGHYRKISQEKKKTYLLAAYFVVRVRVPDPQSRPLTASKSTRSVGRAEGGVSSSEDSYRLLHETHEEQ